MKPLSRWLTCFISVATLTMTLVTSASAASPIGYWKTLDNKTSQPSGIVLIYPVNNRLFAKVVKPIPLPGELPSKDICTKCTGSQHNAPIIGLVFMTDMQQTGPNTWSHGRVLDPGTGKTYQATLKQVDANTLKLKGYVGLPAFGKSAMWIRTTKP